jgi:TatA/E family protein of Tat protein translocase
MNILGMGPLEILLIVVLALIVFGPAKLPEIMGQVGKAINDFRRATSELSDEFNRTIQAELQETRSVIDEAKSAVSDVHANVADLHASVTGMPAPTRTAVPGEALPAPAPNGISSEPHTETLTNGTNGTNGTVQTPVLPPMADTAQWSWETSGPKTPVAETPATEAASTESAATAPTQTDEPGKSASPAPPASLPSQERAAHDELLPPY